MSNDKNEYPFPPNLLRGQTAIITGASRGIGRATALRFAESGANVCINYLKDEAAAEESARQCRAYDVEAVTVRADVARLDEAEMLVETCVRHFNQIDVMVANAGIWEGAAVETMSEDLWERVINANLKGTWTVCRAVVPVMRKQERGSIIIVSSTAGQRGEANYSNYAASKGGQISFTKSLAVELAPHIRVNSVAPGWVDTGMNNDVFTADEYKQKIVNAIPLQRMASSDDIAASIIFLASDWARHITGEILNVNGGAVLCG
jgi:3-oxoacyl-[acyl-carrier protein] reductase